MKEKCKECGCMGIRARGLCWKCYETKRLNGDFVKKACYYCKSKISRTKGLCTKCYAYYIKHNKLERNMYMSNKDIHECGHCGKTSNKYVRGLCYACYKYEKRHGSLKGRIVG